MPAAGSDSGRSMRERWRAALADASGAEFTALVRVDVTLEGSVLLRPMAGRSAAWAALRTAAGIYQEFTYTAVAAALTRSYLEFEAVALGQRVAGVTVLETDGTDRVRAVAVYHRPLPAALAFSAEMRRRLILTVPDPAFYYRSEAPE